MEQLRNRTRLAVKSELFTVYINRSDYWKYEPCVSFFVFSDGHAVYLVEYNCSLTGDHLRAILDVLTVERETICRGAAPYKHYVEFIHLFGRLSRRIQDVAIVTVTIKVKKALRRTA